MLLRPKTGLKDMIVELDPGTPPRRALEGRRHDPGRPDAARRQPRRDPRGARRRHARLPALLLGGGGAGRCGATAGPVEHVPPLRADQPRHREASPGSWRSAARNIARLDPQLPAAGDGARRQGHAARRSWSTPPTPSSGRSPTRTRNLRSDAAACCRRRCSTTQTSAGARSTSSADDARPDARRRCARARARSARRCATRPFLRETTPIIRDQIRPFARDALPTVKMLRPAAAATSPTLTPDLHEHASTSPTTSSTSWPTTRPAREEGYLFWLLVGQPHRHGRLLDPGRARPDPPRPFLVSCSVAGVLRAGRRGQPRAQRGRPPQRAAQAICRRPARLGHAAPAASPAPPRPTRPAGGPSCDAEAGTEPRPDPRHGRASRCRASACCCSCGWPSAARSRSKPKGYRVQDPVRRGDPARQGGRRPHLRRPGRQGQEDRARRERPVARRRSSSTPSTRRSRPTRRRSCARRRCSARPTSS